MNIIINSANMIKRLLIVGTGSAGIRYYNIIKKKHPEIIIKLFSTKRSKADNILYNFNEIKKFLPNACVIANPPTKRIKIIRFLVSINCHLLIEKPLAGTFRDGKKIFKIIKNNTKLIVKVAYNLRFSKSLNIFKKLIKSKKIGKLYFANIQVGQYLPDWRKTPYQKSVSAKKDLGGGVLLELSHEIDYLIWIFGIFNNLYCDLKKTSNLKINTEDLCNLLLVKNNFAVNINLDFCRKDNVRKIYVSGSKGSLKWNWINNKVEFYNEKEKHWITINRTKQSKKDTYITTLNEFFKLIKKKNHKRNMATNLASVNESLNVLKVIDLAKKSSNKSKKLFINK